MARVSVSHGIGDLARDLAAIGPTMVRRGSVVVRKNVRAGNAAARRFARAEAGPHGKNYYKRITAEMTGALEGEWGPEGEPKSNFIGAGYRNDAPNMDLENSQDFIRPKFHRDVEDMVAGLFWGGGDK